MAADPEESSRSDGSPGVIAPHEVFQPGSNRRGLLRVGGRLILDGSAWRLVDAFSAVEVRFGDATGARHEAMTVIEGAPDGSALTSARVIASAPSQAPALEWQRLFHSGLGARLALRARLLGEVRRFFVARGFIEVDTPVRSAECGTETHVEPIASGDRYLITSPELHMKRLLVGGVPRLFQLVHCFRAGERGRLHAPEFSMLEWYRAFEDYTSVLEDTERLVRALHLELSADPWLALPNGTRVDLGQPFLRLSVREAFARFAGVADGPALAARDEDRYFQLLVDRVEPALAELGRPVFLYDYPASQAALARLSPTDPSVAERFELYIGDVELCNGYGELTDPVEQRRRCQLDQQRRESLGRSIPEVPERFIEALSQGMPPASGNALGMDRLLMLLTGQDRIDGVTPFTSEDA